MSICPGDNTVAALLGEALDAEARARLDLHMDTCGHCRRLVADLARAEVSQGADEEPCAGLLPRPGESVGRYQVERVVGAGGMGVVFEATDTLLHRRVALKLLRPGVAAGAGVPLLAEAQAMARLHHPHIVAVHDVGRFHEQVFVCMELVDGCSLRAWRKQRPRGWREVLDVLLAVGRGLAYVHAAGLIHRDVKPDNVLIDRDGRVLLSDFGLARASTPGVAHAPELAGTLAYMAPEQRSGGSVDARADQYSFCRTFVEALGGTAAPPWLRRVLARGLSEGCEDRFASMDELLGELARPRRRKRGLAAAATVALVALAVLGVTWRDGRARLSPTLVAGGHSEPMIDARSGFDTRVASAGAPDREPREPAVAEAARPLALPTGVLPGASPGVATARAPALAEALPASAARSPGAPSRRRRRPPPVAFAWSTGPSARAPVGAPATCDDASELRCDADPPVCPPTTVVAARAGCWTCADASTCAALGLPRVCDDGSPRTCQLDPPRCDGRLVLAVRAGCWTCADPFSCTPPPRLPARSPVRPPAQDPPRAKTCGNQMCEVGEDHASCPSDCCAIGPDGLCAGICGNQMCEVGESHASCPGDCCEIGPDGLCAAVCGDLFCEVGEDHASCPGDCCATGANGRCIPVCGDGMCDEDESPASCPQECAPL